MLRAPRAGLQTDRCAIDEQVSWLGPADRARIQIARQRLGALVGAVPHQHLPRPLLAQRPHRCAGASACTEHERAQPTRRARQRGDQSGSVGVLGGDRSVGREGERVRRADRAGDLARAVGQRERRLLVRDRDVGAEKAGAPERPHRRVEQRRGNG